MNRQRRTLQEHIARLGTSGVHGCTCGREHPVPTARIVLEYGAVVRLPALLMELDVKHPFVLMDENTSGAVGARILMLLDEAGLPYSSVCLPAEPKPQADTQMLPPLLHKAEGCDFILGVGSGVINDLCKMLGWQSGKKTGIVATAPSMDGYASNSSAMIVDGVKTTLYNQTPVLVLGDLAVLASAPLQLRGAGIGDMAAKAISIAEWQIAHIINDEYYCPAIAETMLTACAQAAENAQACMQGDEQAVLELTEGLVLSGIAMSMAQVSRPASGSEHTLSHLMDMLAIARGTEHRLHGVQVGYGVRVALFAYEALLNLIELPTDVDAVLRQFDDARWEQDMHRMFVAQADGLIQTAHKEQRNTEASLRKRAQAARAGWTDIRAILREVIAQKQTITVPLDAAGIPALQHPEALDISKQDVLDLFIHAKDLRARYILPAMVFDLGLLPWMRDQLAAALGITVDRKQYFDPV